MSNAPTQQANRLDRRKARTRAALIRAAQTLIAEGRTNVPILEITQAADVGMGSFYNHFETKEQLFEAAVEAVMDGYGQLLDDLTADIEDPAEVFACSFRLTGRLHRREPELSRVLLNNVLRLLSADNGLAPRARRDIAAAVDAGRFDVEDLDVAVTMAAGALLALGQLLHNQPERDVEETTDRVTEDLLRMFGVTAATGAPDLLAPAAGHRRSARRRLGGLTVRSCPAPRDQPATSAAVHRGRTQPVGPGWAAHGPAASTSGRAFSHIGSSPGSHDLTSTPYVAAARSACRRKLEQTTA